MKKYACTSCAYVYDPVIGEPMTDTAPGTAFEDLPEDWVCPICYEGKNKFVPVEE